MVTKRLCEGDLNENDNFNEWNQTRLVTTFCMGAILTKIAILEMGNESFMVTYICMGAILTDMNI